MSTLFCVKFQAFNWESWRRQWYLELAAKAADLSQSGATAVWLPPPTKSVAAQGFSHLIVKVLLAFDDYLNSIL